MTGILSQPSRGLDAMHLESIYTKLTGVSAVVAIAVIAFGTFASAATRTVEATVDAGSYGVNTQIFVETGQTLTLTAAGNWHVADGNKTADGPAGGDTLSGSCPFGALVARIGFHATTVTHCVGSAASFVAERSGIVFLMSNDIFDGNSGAIGVTIEGEFADAPTLTHGQIATADLVHLQSDWIELASPHIQLTMPLGAVRPYQQLGDRALDWFEAFYSSHEDLSGRVPFLGQPLRFFPDVELTPGVFAYAWNPVRFSYNVSSSLLTDLNAPHPSAWGWVHEMGHLFNVRPNGHHYAIGAAAESWANVFSVHAVEQLGLDSKDIENNTGDISWYFQGGTYSRMDHHVALTMLMDIKNRCGWSAYHALFAQYDQLELEAIPTEDSAFEFFRWSWLADLFRSAAACEVEDIFGRYFVPLKEAHLLIKDLTAAQIAAFQFRIQSLASGLCVASDHTGQAALVQSTCGNGVDAQKWKLVAEARGYHLQSSDGSCVTFESVGSVRFDSCDNETATIFEIPDRSIFGLKTIRAVDHDLCLDVWEGASTPGSTVSSYPCHSRSNQAWNIEVSGS